VTNVAQKRRVAVTGIGLVSCFGTGIAPFAEAIFSGKSGVRRIDTFDVSDFPVKIAATLGEFNPADYLSPKDAKRYDIYISLGVAVAKMALEMAGIQITEENRGRIGVYMGSGIGGIRTLYEQTAVLLQRGQARVSPLFIPNVIANSAAGVIAIEMGITGANFAHVSACSTANHSIGEAFRAVRDGYLDACVAGGAEAAVNPLGLAGFCVMKAVTSEWNDEPQRASRPFDAKRSGFVMGEGAGALVLEEMEHALARGAKIYGEVLGYGATCDAYHITAPAPDGAGAAQAMRLAIEDANLKPEDIDYINAHGTSTELNDKTETQAIKAVFGEHACELAVSSTKSMIGHMLGAAGAAESIATLLALSRQEVPPTINYEFPDPECDLYYTPNVAEKRHLKYALNNSFGFGGHNAVILFGRGKDEIPC